MEKIIDFGRTHKGEVLSQCPEKYLKWLASHENRLAERNRWASRDAKLLLEKKEEKSVEIHKMYKDGYQIVKIDGKFHCQKDGELLSEEYSDEKAIYAKAENAEYFMECIVGDDEEEDLLRVYTAEVDARREGGKSEYLDKLEAQMEARERENAKPAATFILDEQHEVGEIVWSGSLRYRVSESPNYVSAAEADSLEDLDPNARSGWYTKVELVA